MSQVDTNGQDIVANKAEAEATDTPANDLIRIQGGRDLQSVVLHMQDDIADVEASLKDLVDSIRFAVATGRPYKALQGTDIGVITFDHADGREEFAEAVLEYFWGQVRSSMLEYLLRGGSVRQADSGHSFHLPMKDGSQVQFNPESIVQSQSAAAAREAATLLKSVAKTTRGQRRR